MVYSCCQAIGRLIDGCSRGRWLECKDEAWRGKRQQLDKLFGVRRVEHI